jgi:CheY-like chemotaxis protein
MKEGLNLLIVEDSENDRFFIQSAFEEQGEGTHIQFEESCLTAINVVGLKDFDFALIDFRLGAIDAQPLINILYKLELPFAILSGSSEIEIRERLNDTEKKILIWHKNIVKEVPGLVKKHIG